MVKRNKIDYNEVIMIKTAEFIISGTSLAHFPQDNKNEYLLLGRSNVGKSSLINYLTNRKSLARTSQNPGKTITLNFYLLNDDFYLVDAPGYGYAKRGKSTIASFEYMIEDYLTGRPNLKKVLLLVDYKVGPTEDDILMYEYLTHFDHEIIVVATKVDKLNQKETAQSKKRFKEYFKDTKVILTSVNKKIGLENLLNEFEENL